MRRSIAITVSIIYGILSVGIHLHMHYCCGKLSDISLVTNTACDHGSDNQSCGKKSDHCCNFQDIALKIDDSHSASYFKIVLPAVEISSPGFKGADEVLSIIATNQHVVYAHAPPADIPIYLSCCSLIFYA